MACTLYIVLNAIHYKELFMFLSKSVVFNLHKSFFLFIYFKHKESKHKEDIIMTQKYFL